MKTPLGLHAKRWTRDELVTLRSLWETRSVRQIAARLGRTICSVYSRAHAMGLTRMPEGWESWSASCRRTGYEAKQLRRILNLLHVPIKQRNGWRNGSRSHHIIEIDAVNRAVCEFQKLETVGSLAEKSGMSTEQVWRRLKQAGIPAPGRGRTVRFEARIGSLMVRRTPRQTARAA